MDFVRITYRNPEKPGVFILARRDFNAAVHDLAPPLEEVAEEGTAPKPDAPKPDAPKPDAKAAGKGRR